MKSKNYYNKVEEFNVGDEIFDHEEGANGTIKYIYVDGVFVDYLDGEDGFSYFEHISKK